jgi:hypothetical protein
MTQLFQISKLPQSIIGFCLAIVVIHFSTIPHVKAEASGDNRSAPTETEADQNENPDAEKCGNNWYDWATLGGSCVVKSMTEDTETEDTEDVYWEEDDWEDEDDWEENDWVEDEQTQGACGDNWYDWATLGGSCVIKSVTETDSEESECGTPVECYRSAQEKLALAQAQQAKNALFVKEQQAANDKLLKEIQDKLAHAQQLFKEQRAKNEQFLKQQQTENDQLLKEQQTKLVQAQQFINTQQAQLAQAQQLIKAQQAKNVQLLKEQRIENERLLKEQQDENQRLLKAQQTQNEQLLKEQQAKLVKAQQLVTTQQEQLAQAQQLIGAQQAKNQQQLKEQRTENERLLKEKQDENQRLLKAKQAQNKQSLKEQQDKLVKAQQFINTQQAQLAQAQQLIEAQQAKHEQLLKEQRTENEQWLKEQRTENERLLKEQQEKNQRIIEENQQLASENQRLMEQLKLAQSTQPKEKESQCPEQRVYYDKSANWLNETHASTYTTLVSRELTLSTPTEVTIIGSGYGHTTHKDMALYVAIFIDGTLFDRWEHPNYHIGWGTGITHNSFWVPITAMAALKLTAGTHTIELKYRARKGNANSNAYFNAPLMITTLHCS